MIRKKKRIFIPRLVPKISTSSKVFIDKKTKANSRRSLNKLAKYDV